MKAACFVLAASALLVAEDATKKDHAAIQGTWIIVTSGDDANILNLKVEFKDNAFKLHFPDGAKEGTFKIDATTDPKLIDLKFDNKDFEGIYVLDGDKLKIHVSEPCANQRPTEFPKDGKRLVALKREKK